MVVEESDGGEWWGCEWEKGVFTVFVRKSPSPSEDFFLNSGKSGKVSSSFPIADSQCATDRLGLHTKVVCTFDQVSPPAFLPEI